MEMERVAGEGDPQYEPIAKSVLEQISHDFELITEIWRMKGYTIGINGDLYVSVQRIDSQPSASLN